MRLRRDGLQQRRQHAAEHDLGGTPGQSVQTVLNTAGLQRFNPLMDPASWLAAAFLAAGRNLTDDEWAQYIGADEPYRQPTGWWTIPVDVGVVLHVTRQGDRTHTASLDLRHGGLERGHRATGDRDRRALGRQGEGDPTADTLAAAGDQRDLSRRFGSEVGVS